jgi:ribose transport system substrate-binding protein
MATSKANRLRQVAAGLLVTYMAFTTAACSSSSTSDQSTSTDGSQGGSSSLEAAKAQLDKYSKTAQDMQLPGGPIAGLPGKLKGKTIYYIPIFYQAPLFHSEFSVIKSALGKLGATAQVCPGNANPADITACFKQAIGGSAAGIITDSIPPELVPQAFKSAAQAKVPVVAMNTNKPLDAQFADNARAFNINQALQARLTADQVIVDSGGTAKVVVMGISDSHTSRIITEKGILATFAKCAKCSVHDMSINSNQMGTIPTLVSTALVQHPDTDYLFLQYDNMVQSAIQGLATQGKSKTVKVVSTNADLGALKRIANGSQFADSGNDITYEAYGSLDSLFRMITGSPDVTEKTAALMPIRTFNAANVKGLELTDAALESGSWYSSGGFRDDFLKLWGVRNKG